MYQRMFRWNPETRCKCHDHENEKSTRVLPLSSALLIFASPAAGRAENLFRLYPEVAVKWILFRQRPAADPAMRWAISPVQLVAGFYLDYTSAARYASLHYDTFAQLFTHQTRFDRAGEGQFVSATDDENLSPTTKLRFDELFYRDAPTFVGIVTSDQAPEFNSVAAQLLLANDQATINQFNADIVALLGTQLVQRTRRPSDDLLEQGGSNGSSNNSTSYEQSISTVTEYHFSDRFSLGAGYRFYDFRFSLPGQPGEQAHWPFVRVGWRPLRNLYRLLELSAS